MREKDYTAQKKDLSISMEKANFYSIFAAIPPIAFLYVAYIARWGNEKFFKGFDIIFGNFINLLLILIIGIVLHEIIHGLS